MFLRVGTWQIAERKSIVVSDEDIQSNLFNDSTASGTGTGDTSGCGGASSSDGGASGNDGGSCVGAVQNREIIFTLRFVGKIASSDTLYRSLDTYLTGVCASNPVLYQRRVCDEQMEEHTITKAWMQRRDMSWERLTGTKSGEVHLVTADLGDNPSGRFTLIGLPPSVTV